MRFLKSTTDEGTMTKTNLKKRINTIAARNFVKTLAQQKVTSIESYRQAAQELVRR